MDPADLRALLTTLRESGVTFYEAGGVRIVLGPVSAGAAGAVAAVTAPAREEDQEARLDRLAFGRLFSAAGVTRG